MTGYAEFLGSYATLVPSLEFRMQAPDLVQRIPLRSSIIVERA